MTTSPKPPKKRKVTARTKPPRLPSDGYTGPLPPLSHEQWAAWRALVMTHSLYVPILSKRLHLRLGMYWNEYMVLATLGRERERATLEMEPDLGVRISDISVAIGATIPGARAAIERLRGDEGALLPGKTYVQLSASKTDKRGTLVTLTPDGIELLRVADLEVSWFARKWFVDAGSDEDLAGLYNLLSAMCSRLDAKVDHRLPPPRVGPRIGLVPKPSTHPVQPSAQSPEEPT